MKNQSGKLVRASRIAEIARKVGGVFVVATNDPKVLEATNASKVLSAYKYVGRQCEECSTTFATALVPGMLPHCICCGSSKTKNATIAAPRIAQDKDLAYFDCKTCTMSSILPKALAKSITKQHCVCCGVLAEMTTKAGVDATADSGDMPSADDLDLVDTDASAEDCVDDVSSLADAEDGDGDADDDMFASASADPESQSGPVTLNGNEDAPEAGGGSSDMDELIKRETPDDQDAREAQEGSADPESQSGPVTLNGKEKAPEAGGGSSDMDELIKREGPKDQTAREIQVGDAISPEQQSGPVTLNGDEDAPEASGGSSDAQELIKRPEAEDQDAREVQVGDATIDDEIAVDMLANTDEEDCKTIAFVGIGKNILMLANNAVVASLSPEDAGENASIMQTESFRTALSHTIDNKGLKKACALYGFKPVTASIPLKKIVDARVAKETASMKKAHDKALKEMADTFQQATDIAAAGFAQNYWRKRQNPLIAALVRELNAVNIRKPQTLVDNVMKGYAVAHMREVLAVARELAGKPRVALDSIAEAIDLGSYLPARPAKVTADADSEGDEPVGDETSGADEDVTDETSGNQDDSADDVESALDSPAEAVTAGSVNFKTNRSGNRSSEVANILGGDTVLFH